MHPDKEVKIFDQSAVIYRYAPAAWLRVTGEDALAFLQGQFTQDLRSSPVSYGLWLNQKGRVVADSFAVRVGASEVWLLSYASPAAVIRERLEAYVIADDVTIEDVTSTWQGVAILGEGAGEWLARQIGTLPGAGEFARVGEGFVFRGRRSAGESWEWLTLASVAAASELPELSSAEVERRRIAARIPAIPTDVGPGDLPNEAGLETDAISYTKGCYLGQEVMARLKSMGQVRRRLLLVTGPAAAPDVRPAALFQGERRVGELRSAVSRSDGSCLGLAMIATLGLDPAAPLALAPGAEPVFRLTE